MKFNLFGKISSGMVDRPKIIWLVLVLIVFMGTIAYTEIPKEAAPDVKLPVVEIETAYIGASPEDTEKLVTNVIEDAISNLGDVKEMSSISAQGVSNISIEFSTAVEIDSKVEEIEKILERISSELPDKAEDPVVTEFDVSSIPTIVVNLSGEYDLVQLKNYAEDIKSEISKNKNVSAVVISGGKEREIRIEVDSAKLSQINLSISDIENVISNNNINTPIGQKEYNGEIITLRTVNEYESLEQIRNTVITVRNGQPVLLKNIGEVKDSYSDKYGLSKKVINYKTSDEKLEDVISLVVTKRNGTNAIQINREIKEKMNNMRGQVYPEDIEVQYTNDFSLYIDRSLSELQNTALSGLLAVIIVLFLFMGLKEALIVAVVIPISLLVTTIVFSLFGYTYNVYTLMGLIMALGMLVDNAIVVVENIDIIKRVKGSVKIATKFATNEVAPAIFASTITTIGAFLPLALMGGIEGQVVRYIPVATIIAMVSSFVLSITVTPVLSSILIKNDRSQLSMIFERIIRVMSVALVVILSLTAFSNQGQVTTASYVAAFAFGISIIYKLYFSSSEIHEGKVISKYGVFIQKILSKTWTKLAVILLAVLLFISTIFPLMSGRIAFEAMPKTDTTNLTVYINLPTGRTVSDVEEIMEQVFRVIRDHDEVIDYSTDIGTYGKDGFSTNKALLRLELTPKADRSKHSEEVMVNLQNSFDQIPGAQISFQNINYVNVSAPINIKLTGDDLEKINIVAQEYSEVLKSIEGVESVVLSKGTGYLQKVIEFDKVKAAMLGLDTTSMSMEVRKLMLGSDVSSISLDGDNIEIKLIDDLYYAKDAEELKRIQFRNTSGKWIPFESVAKVKDQVGRSTIFHVNGKKLVNIIATPSHNIAANKVVEAFNKKIEELDMIDPDVSIDQGGDMESMIDTFTDLLQKFVIAMILVYIVLVLQFDSFLQPAIIILTVPFAFIGVIYGHFALGLAFGTLSFFGLISLVGISINDAIVLIDRINQNRSSGMNDINTAVLEGVKSRFVPVIATSVTTICGVLPMALYNPDYSQMAYTLIFGLLASTVLVLLVIPIVYALINGK